MDIFNGSSEITTWVVIPVLIFVARLIDVTLATLRHILITRGAKRLVPALGFVEVLVWLLAMTQIVNNLSNVVCYLAWAGGFSAGTYVGMVIEEKLALGHQLVRVVSQDDCTELVSQLRAHGHGVTVIPAQGGKGPVEVILIATTRSNAHHLMGAILRYNPKLFLTLEDVRSVGSGVFTGKRSRFTKSAGSKTDPLISPPERRPSEGLR